MDRILNFIYIIQSIAGVCGMAKITYLILANLHEEDTSLRNKKIRKVIIAVILIETGLTLAAIIKSYYQ